jgi:lipopolysaccharide transport system ATP-binding protein
MNDTAIRLRGLKKIYRLYGKPHHRFLDMFGLLPKRQQCYSEHAALSGIDLEIRRGEKVAIIGRNGAGKSTLLKLVTRVIEPTEGSIETVGDVHALLQIGTGFHPDFTGRQNVFSYLAHLGVNGKEAERKFAEIVEFAELDEYIDQPVKTYSTGMGVRLMFSTSTAIEPDILVIDEVLGVGDAYFVHRSFERINELCMRRSTTLLLVTHDIYSAMKLCERFVWIDRGRILIDGSAALVANRYESSIRDQEERRMRRRRLAILEEKLARPGSDGGNPVLYGQIRVRGTVPIDTDLPIAAITLFNGQTDVARIFPARESECQGGGIISDEKEGNWTPATIVDGRSVRCFTPTGSIYHRAPFFFAGQHAVDAVKSGEVELELEFKDLSSSQLVAEIFLPDDGERVAAELEGAGSDGGWVRRRFRLRRTTGVDTAESGRVRYGTQDLSVVNVEFFDGNREECHIFQVGGAMIIRLSYVIRNPKFKERPAIHVSFVRDGIRTHRFVLETAEFDYLSSPEGYIEALVDPIAFGPGKYIVNIAAVREGFREKGAAHKFFTTNDEIYDHHSRGYEIMVEATGNQFVDTCAFLHPVSWVKDGRKVSSGTYWLDSETVRRQVVP